MGKTYTYIPEDLIDWAERQKAFWVATAPLDGEGHVNVSPKGVEGTFHFVNKNRVWYEDLTGSGAETVSHLRENGRITILLQAFDGGPRILRLFGKGTVHEFGTPEYEALLPPDRRQPGSRAAIVVDVHRVGTSCGWAVPFYQYVGPRDTLTNWGVKLEKGDGAALKKYWNDTNVRSVDGLPGLQVAPTAEAVPDAVIKEVKGGLPKYRSTQTAAVQKGGQLALIPLLLAFASGILATIVFVRFSVVAREMVVLSRIT